MSRNERYLPRGCSQWHEHNARARGQRDTRIIYNTLPPGGRGRPVEEEPRILRVSFRAENNVTYARMAWRCLRPPRTLGVACHDCSPLFLIVMISACAEGRIISGEFASRPISGQSRPGKRDDSRSLSRRSREKSEFSRRAPRQTRTSYF